ncbi:hypothetical protein [Paraburkholderia susongensis]|uniref:Uncharacterized protein n=1 Tax=Paraburkholderia susongensis TaxID=1515439 RepID=A0A1X7LQ84_9BURK|nr:hypothetical protein [Paraburkholderia susongensis]SMG55664.1 hypothetical protein SAMN06265784_107283 [Paraburkholderia susongensis]
MNSGKHIALVALALFAALTSADAIAQDTPNAVLEVSVNGTVYKGQAEYEATGSPDSAAAMEFLRQNSIHLLPGGTAQLKVDLVGADGSRTDVTDDTDTHYAAVTNWNLDVSATGVVTQRADPKYSAANAKNSKDGQIIVWYKKGTTLGFNAIEVIID